MSAAPLPFLPDLETRRLRLRPLGLGDMEFVFRHFSNPDVMRYLLDEEPVRDLTGARRPEAGGRKPAGQAVYRWGIADRESGQLIGTCGFHRWNAHHCRAETGYDLDPAYWGRGLMKEALAALLKFGFSDPSLGFGLHRVEALVYVDNQRSLRLLEKLGFRQEARLRGYFQLHGEYYDHYLYSLLKPEFEPGE